MLLAYALAPAMVIRMVFPHGLFHPLLAALLVGLIVVVLGAERSPAEMLFLGGGIWLGIARW